MDIITKIATMILLGDPKIFLEVVWEMKLFIIFVIAIEIVFWTGAIYIYIKINEWTEK